VKSPPEPWVIESPTIINLAGVATAAAGPGRTTTEAAAARAVTSAAESARRILMRPLCQTERWRATPA